MNKFLSSLTVVAMTASLLTPFASHAAELSSYFNAGDLIKGSGSAVYYFAQDGRRYVFPNEKTYFTWYRDFSHIVTIPDEHLYSIPLGRTNITYRPGAKMIKITTDPKVYVVDRGGVLRHVTTEQLARSLYNLNWNDRIDDVADSYFTNYRVGTPIQTATDYNPADVMTLTPTVSDDKGFDRTQITMTIGNVRSGFVPTTFTVKKGTRVTWTNADTTDHTVTGNGWTSPTIHAGESWSYTFNTAGSFDYHCNIHPVMQGTINVVN
jgi:plastocyanin